MGLTWLLALAVAVSCAGADRGGSSLRGALEALQRRQRGRMHGPVLPQPDYDALYEFVPPQAYPDFDYPVAESIEDEPPQKYYVKLLDDDPRPPESYEYKLIKKKNMANSVAKKESAFRERSHHSDNERLRDLFMDKNEAAAEKKVLEDASENDAEYALLLGQLWSKYKFDKEHANNVESAPQGVVKLYKEKIVKKRYPDNWGPIAFKRKRSPDADTDHPVLFGYDARKSGPDTVDPNYNGYDVSDEDKDDLREEYAIAFQPLDDDSLSDLADDGDQYTYDTLEKRFPVSKRSSGPYSLPKKRFVQSQNKREASKTFRSSAGTDPKLLKDLSKIFGDSEISFIKSPVKRNTDHEEHAHEHEHEVKPPMITTAHNDTHGHNNSVVKEDDSHEHHGHNIHHPGITGKEVEHEHTHDHAHDHGHGNSEKPIRLAKKSVDWSDYFGIDKRTNQPVFFSNDYGTQNKLRKQYEDTFNKEVIYPLKPLHRSTTVKRNYVETKPNEETEIQIDRAHLAVQKDEKRTSSNDENDNLDNIDKKLRNLEGIIVDEALYDSKVGMALDTKEEQEMKEKLLSRLAAAYSLEKMRKALKEFKQSLQIQKTKPSTMPAPAPTDESKAKRIAIKKEKVEMLSNEIPSYVKEHQRVNDFEDEQGAGHYVNGKNELQYSEGYMGGSGRHRIPVMSTESATGACPVLGKIMQRCRGVDLLAGDRGQLFLPLCSLHQICQLCGEAPPTTCDLMFLSEADTTCDGDMGCQRAARSALMALRELHDNLADELDGECEASPCLPATLRLNGGWQRAFLR